MVERLHRVAFLAAERAERRRLEPDECVQQVRHRQHRQQLQLRRLHGLQRGDRTNKRVGTGVSLASTLAELGIESARPRATPAPGKRRPRPKRVAAPMANPRHDGDLICAAARDGDLNHIASLISRGVPPDSRESQFGSTPLHWSGQVRVLMGASSHTRLRCGRCAAPRAAQATIGGSGAQPQPQRSAPLCGVALGATLAAATWLARGGAAVARGAAYRARGRRGACTAASWLCVR